MNGDTSTSSCHGGPSFLARCIRGIEWILAAEIQERLQAESLFQGHREIRFPLEDLPDLSDLRLATADDIFLIVGEVDGVHRWRSSLGTLARGGSGLRWAASLDALRRLRPEAGWTAFTISASMRGKRNYNRYEIEDSLAEAVIPKLGLAYRATREGRGTGTELGIRVHVVEDRAPVAVRVFDSPLHRRRYKANSCPGTLHPPLAAAMALLAGLRPGCRLLDPFAGVGTIPIEAELVQGSIRGLGADVAPERVASATDHARRAGTGTAFIVADAGELPFPAGAAERIATNLPWGSQVPLDGVAAECPGRRSGELGRVLADGGRAVLLVDQDDPVGFGPLGHEANTLRHRSWLSVFGQHPRLCVFAAEGGHGAGAIDLEAPMGRSLLRNLYRADTVEFMASGTTA